MAQANASVEPMHWRESASCRSPSSAEETWSPKPEHACGPRQAVSHPALSDQYRANPEKLYRSGTNVPHPIITLAVEGFDGVRGPVDESRNRGSGQALRRTPDGAGLFPLFELLLPAHAAFGVVSVVAAPRPRFAMRFFFSWSFAIVAVFRSIVRSNTLMLAMRSLSIHERHLCSGAGRPDATRRALRDRAAT